MLIDVRVGTEKSVERLLSDASYVTTLAADPTFQRLLGECADECAGDWSRGKTVDQREAAFSTLQGVRKFAQWLQVVIDRGTEARKVLERDARDKG